MLSPEIQDAMKSLIAAIRIVKIYPPNNPVYSQSIKKSHEALSHFLQSKTECRIGVQKNFFTCGLTPFGKDAQVNRAIVQDLFAKGIREILFTSGITDGELQALYLILALSPEELAMRSGISTILWEKGVANIKVTEAGLEEVITAQEETGTGKSGDASEKQPVQKGSSFSGKTLLLSDVKTDPEGFGASMIALAARTRAEHESVEDRLFSLYQQAGNKILRDHANERDSLFEGLAESVLALDPPYREALIAGKLYGSVDAETAAGQKRADEQLPDLADEVRAGRFDNAWNSGQVATLLKRTVSKNVQPPVEPVLSGELQATPIPGDLVAIARHIEEEGPEQAEGLRAVGNSGMESDIIEASVRTLIFLIPLVKNPRRAGTVKKELSLFSRVVQQLEDILGYLLKKNNYELATIIIEALHMPVDPEFKQRMTEALKKTATKTIVKETIAEMRKHESQSPEYLSAYAYLSSLDRKATEVLLELLADESDREARLYLLDLLKDFGKKQTALLGERLSDERWYVVRNIVSILGETKTDQSIMMLRKAADHKNVKIRQEVIKGLISYGGRKAAGLLARFLRDEDRTIQLMAAQAFPELQGITTEDATPLIEFLGEQPLKKKEQELTAAVIRALGKVGGWEAADFLKKYSRIRWWKSRGLQVELRDAAMRSIEQIKRREHGGRTNR